MDLKEETDTITVSLHDLAKGSDNEQLEMEFGDLLTLDDSNSVIDTTGPFNSSASTITLSPDATVNVSSPTYTITGDYSTDYGFNDLKNSAKISLDGDDADIVVNGRSLMDALDKIEQRMAILVPNTEIESEWDELKQLGDQYRELEAQLKEKTKMWDTLKSQPAPDLEDL